MSTAFEEKVKRCATALAGYRAAILFNFSLGMSLPVIKSE